MQEPPAWIVRPEAPGDAASIDHVLRRAFSGPNAADLVQALRHEGGYDLELSLVAVEPGPAPRLVGHVLFSPMAIVHGEAPAPAMALGPLGVLPARQRSGVGTALVREGLARCRARGLGIVLVLGDPGYYRRFGFASAPAQGIEPPQASWAGAYQVLELLPGALREAQGTARYPPAWNHA